METPSLMNFKNLLVYPFKDKKSGTKILIGSLLIFSSAIIPILPALIVLGYIMQIAKRIIDGDGQLSMPDWDQWSEYLKEGFKWFVVLLLYAIPLILVFSFGYFIYMLSFIGLAVVEESANPSFWSLVLPFFGMGVFFVSLFIGIILALFEFLFLPAGLMHIVHTGKISSIFKLREWWPLMRKNFLGFLVAMIFLFGFYYFMMMAFSALYLSVLLCIVIPFAMAPLTFLMGLWTIPLFAQAYREVKPEAPEVPESAE
ncbi:MAG: DUF4013 domain-containing protein [Anaerolineaceae bacterium]|nr:DUF4013 domain-containing protein [Anaerolineaceae bacterium]